MSICREHGMGHIGPWIFGVCALVEDDAETRRHLLADGMTQLARGCVSHNHIYLRDLAIDVSLDLGDWPEAERHCEDIRSYTAGEPLPMSDFIAARGLALARHGRGERSAELSAALVELRDVARRAGLNAALPAIERALVGRGNTAS